MSWTRIAAAAALLCFPLLRSGAQEPARANSTVFFAQDDQAIAQFEENAERTRPMVDALVLALTGQPDLAKAWGSLVSPADRVGIKIATSGGRYFSSHHGIVAAIVAGLESAGVRRDRIIIWDRNSSDLRAAGYLPSPREVGVVQAIDPPRGYDREAPMTAPVLGKLMWGDLLFAEKQRTAFGKAKNDGDQLSSTSHLARIVSRDVTKIINVPVLSDDHGCGVAGAIYNASVPNVDNWRRFTHADGTVSTSPAEVYADERIGPKVVLHIMDALLAQYAGGPAFNPNYSFAHQTIYASKDPVALDAVALRKIEEWRKQAKLPSIARQAAWLASAAEMGLGNVRDEAIVLRQVEPAK